jgi:para-nitrobenzyl esterase
VRSADRFGSVFPSVLGGASAEDSWYANVWTPDVGGRLPVLVYVHGGGWQLGAGSLSTYDGSRLAERGGLVVVTFNYRLGPFGFGLHDDLVDPETGLAANWGLQDQVALLRWVRVHAAAFGGDPDNITLAGTSAGGASAHQLALRAEVRPLIRRIVTISAAHVRTPVMALTPEDSHAAYSRVARELGTSVAGLRGASGEAVFAAWNGLFVGDPGGRVFHSGREYRGPVVDGVTMVGHDHEAEPPDLPVLSVYARDEGTFFTMPGLSAFAPAPAPVDAGSLRAAVRGVLAKFAVDGDGWVDECLDVYGGDDPAGVWARVWGDGMFREPIVRMALRHVERSSSPVHVVEFAHPAVVPGVGAPHEATSKFLFGTYADPAHVAVFGDGPEQRAVSDRFIDLVASFARDGRPGGVPGWGGRDVLVLDGRESVQVTRLGPDDRSRFWDRVLA